MPTIEVKFGYGQEVNLANGTPAIITAIIIRDTYHCYELCYFDENGEPKVYTASEIELLKAEESKKIGFNRRPDRAITDYKTVD